MKQTFEEFDINPLMKQATVRKNERYKIKLKVNILV